MACKEHKQQFKGILREGGLKATPKRLEMLEIFIHESKPVSIEDLWKKMLKKIDIVTLYRNVEALGKLGILKRIRLNQQKYYYEFAKQMHHHHLVCTECGVVKDVENCKVPSISLAELKNSGFAKINSHELEFFGLCAKCVK